MQGTDLAYIPYGVSPNGGAHDILQYRHSRVLWHWATLRPQNSTVTLGTVIPTRVMTLAFGGNVFQQQTPADFQAFQPQLAPGISTPSSFTTGCSDGSVVHCATFGQSTTAGSTYGWYVEPRLNFASRFFVAPGFRLDGGSATGTHVSTNAGGVNIPGLTGFPKIDLSYLAVDRSKPHGPVSLLRPRLAFGYAGTQPNPTSKLRLINGTAPGLNLGNEGSLASSFDGSDCTNGTPINGTLLYLACVNALGNTQLRPERTAEFEGGADMELWGGRMSLTWTQYLKVTKDAIIELPVAPSVYSPLSNTGGTSIADNIGEVRNTGTEVTLSTMLLETRRVSWNINTSLSTDHNLLVHLNPGQVPIVIASQTLGSQVRITPGYPLFGVWARPLRGFADANHDGKLEPNEIQVADSAVYVGVPNPKYQMSFSTNLALLHGALTVNATFAYQNGLKRRTMRRPSSMGPPRRS